MTARRTPEQAGGYESSDRPIEQLPRVRPGPGPGGARHPRPPRINPGPPYVEVEQVGRWTWAVRVCHGIIVWGPNGGPFIVRGSRDRADRVAGRKLAEYLRREERSASTAHRVTL